MATGRIQKDLEYGRIPFREAFIQRGAFPDEEFLHKKINNSDVYVDHGSTEDIPEDAFT